MSFDPLGAPLDELAAHLGGSGRARALWQSLLNSEALPSSARARLASESLAPAAVETRSRAADGTTKLLVRLQDSAAVETVLIPGRGRTTLCLSTQVGCARRCVFCVTATMGLQRNLSAGEIVAQVLLGRTLAAELGLPPLRNVVYMGMGEPLDNLDEVRRSLRVLTDPRALALAPRHVTVSTVGTSPRAIRAAQDLPGHLAWSVHAVDDGLRRELVPTTRHEMSSLRDAFVEVAAARGQHLFLELTLIEGKNDDEACALALADFCEPFTIRPRLNLLPMNRGRDGLSPSSLERTARFQAVLRQRGYFCVVRRARGAEAAAACGQLVVSRGASSPALSPAG